MQEFQADGFTFEVEWVHAGQRRPYGDTFRVANIKTNAPREKVIELIGYITGYSGVPEKKDWNPHEIDSYFGGYFELETIDGGFKYTKCEPYTD